MSQNEKTGEQFNVEIEILKLLSKGFTQSEVSEELQKKGIAGTSLSSVEKKLKTMRDEMGCKTLFQLMYKCGTMGILK